MQDIFINFEVKHSINANNEIVFAALLFTLFISFPLIRNSIFNCMQNLFYGNKREEQT